MPRLDFVKSNFYDFYNNIDYGSYQTEKARLQIELLKLQHWVIENKKRVALVFEGRDAAGKGSSIKRFVEYMMPKHYRVVELGIPTKSESRNWFRRYERHLPEPGEVVFFDRSWYNRALIEPTMGYCTRAQYKYFMGKVLPWEEALIDDGLILIKIYLSISKNTQLVRFRERIQNPLKYWKYSENDEKVRERWDRFTRYKEQMFRKTSSPKSPWVIINSNNKLDTRLKAMLYIISAITYRDGDPFEPMKKKQKQERYSLTVQGVPFHNLNYRQFRLLQTVGAAYDA